MSSCFRVVESMSFQSPFLRFPLLPQQTVAQKKIYQRNSLSEHDLAWLILHYRRDRPADSTPDWMVSHALDVVGVTESHKSTMLGLPARELRKQYLKWVADCLSAESEPVIALPTPSKPSPSTPDQPFSEILPDWFRKTCADLAPLTSKDPSKHAYAAVVTRVAVLWDSSAVSLSCCDGRSFAQRFRNPRK